MISSDSLIERVARAVYASHPVAEILEWEELDEADRQAYLQDAEVAVAAIREDR